MRKTFMNICRKTAAFLLLNTVMTGIKHWCCVDVRYDFPWTVDILFCYLPKCCNLSEDIQQSCWQSQL